MVELLGQGETMKVIAIPIKDIEQNENSRVIYKKAELSELIHSLKHDGQLQPIGVRKLPSGKYDCVFGNRRLVAVGKLGWKEISAHVLEGIDKESERDILGLLENLKRQNTTVAEDGRMFCVLRDAGLSVHEIAARLDTSLQRIETAIDVHTEAPKEYKALIVNRTTGTKTAGTISASAAHLIMNMRKKNGLNRKQTRSLLDMARKDDTSMQHIAKIAPLLKQGHTLPQAIHISSGLDRVTLTLFLPSKTVLILEKKYGKTIHELLTNCIRADKEFKLYEG